MSLIDVADLDQKIRMGKGLEVRSLLEKKSLNRIKSSQIYDVCMLMCRVGFSNKVLRYLHPFIRNKELSRPSEKIKVAYAFALLLQDLVEEAQTLLLDVDCAKYPYANFIKGLIDLKHWDYTRALERFSDYLKSDSITPYQRSVGRLNYVSCLISTDRLDEAEIELQNLMKSSKSQGLNLVYANSLELKSQILIERKKYLEALELLKNSAELLKMSNSKSELFTEKWKFLAELETGSLSDTEIQEKYSQIRKKADDFRHYETMRSLDYLLARETNNVELMKKNFFLSPYSAYKLRISSSDYFEIPDEYLLGTKDQLFFDRSSGALEYKNKRRVLSQSSSSYRILMTLTSDAYKPFSVERIHSLVFKDEYFNPESGINRVHQAFSRLRKMIKSELGVELNLLTDRGYALDFSKICVRYVRDKEYESKDMERWARLVEKFGPNRSFCAREAAEALTVSKRTVNRLLNLDQYRNRLEIKGTGKSTIYSISPKVA